MTPDVEPGTYAKPSGSVSEIESRSTASAPSFVIVIVYVTTSPGPTVGSSTILSIETTVAPGSQHPSGPVVPSTSASTKTAES